jgi:hypothetical protein
MTLVACGHFHLAVTVGAPAKLICPLSMLNYKYLLDSFVLILKCSAEIFFSEFS